MGTPSTLRCHWLRALCSCLSTRWPSSSCRSDTDYFGIPENIPVQSSFHFPNRCWATDCREPRRGADHRPDCVRRSDGQQPTTTTTTTTTQKTSPTGFGRSDTQRGDRRLVRHRGVRRRGLTLSRLLAKRCCVIMQLICRAAWIPNDAVSGAVALLWSRWLSLAPAVL
ncbi:hypothetical protein F2P81_017436 [Scophthalmus maximus]|uniref:Uncharacterized protein n=1 Tax=Scophthalmus maximus TaxID=52904 RepID=A0A6A4SDY0_SCOMX|nr:hypothetical protein F2P81_017436 [Scophthalmus maximus]